MTGRHRRERTQGKMLALVMLNVVLWALFMVTVWWLWAMLVGDIPLPNLP